MAVNVCCCVKLSPNKKSIFGLSIKNQILYLVIVASLFVVVSSADAETSCAKVKTFFEKKGVLLDVDIQEQANSDAGGLCLNKGCCGPKANVALTQRAHQQLTDSLRSELAKLADILSVRARKFDEFFRKLLKVSREEFHNMFKRTYGMIYEQHSYVFEQLFEQLQNYYTRGDTNFDKMMDDFFGILYEKMFTVLNSQYSFDQKAFNLFIYKVELSSECGAAWARLRWCGACGGVTAPACSRYCHNVLRGCLHAHADLADLWDAYVDSVEKVADRLQGPFNIAMVVEPIDIKISEAIMSFQEHNQEISQKIFAGCGKPNLGGDGGAGPFFAPDRSRRFARSIPDFDWNQKANDVDDFEIEASFESLVNNDPSLVSLQSPESIRKAAEEMGEQAKSRERFLQYMRGHIDLEEYEEHERRRREAGPDAAGGDIYMKPFDFEGKRGSKKKKPIATKSDDVHGAEWGSPVLERLMRETRARVRGSRRYWAQLPAALCAPLSVTTAPCYNGSALASYTSSTAGDGSAALASNPEVRSAGSAGPAARAQADALRALTARLKDAYNGVEVQWKDEDKLQETAAAASGLDLVAVAGSGSGSGDDGDDELPDDDEDRDSNLDYPEGSGESQPTEEVTPEAVTEPRLVAVTEAPVGAPGGAVGGGAVRVRQPDTSSARAPPATSSSEAPHEVPAVEEAVPGAATRPSLSKALFTYALPVVCAWFGTIVTDLF
ncbi:PREDICTED: glypican-6-like [Papilio xuthus]|uniref:Glypican-6-like n=1 Tax=Papilio xuthus TaxID=66420 RepID=A0AAJ6Z1N1_PAPXU|nr:PREDICTED: glypican-6-like [Papilio xuthus]